MSEDKQIKLFNILRKHKELFDGTLGTLKGIAYKIELRDNVKPYHARAYSIPQAYERTFRIEVK